MFGDNCEILCNPSYNAIYCFPKKVKDIGVFSPKIMFYIFDTLVRLILTYGNDVWGIGKKRLTQVDKIFLQLHVVYYMLNSQHVMRLFMGNVVGFHLAHFARSTPHVS